MSAFNYLCLFAILNIRSCSHENIVRLYDVFEDEDHIYLLMELADGDLAGLLKEHIQVPLPGKASTKEVCIQSQRTKETRKRQVASMTTTTDIVPIIVVAKQNGIKFKKL